MTTWANLGMSLRKLSGGQGSSRAMFGDIQEGGSGIVLG
jgi:hypothetical protein